MCETRYDNIVTQIVFINTIDSNRFYNSTNELWGYRTLHMYQTYTTLQSMCSYLSLDVSRSAALRRKRQYFEFRTRAFLVQISPGEMAKSKTVLNPTIGPFFEFFVSNRIFETVAPPASTPFTTDYWQVFEKLVLRYNRFLWNTVLQIDLEFIPCSIIV